MGIDIRNKQYQADRDTFNAAHKASGNGSFPSMRRAELEAFAKQGNTYARHQLQNDRQADMAVFSGEAQAALTEADANGRAAHAIEKLSDATTSGAHRNIRDSWNQAVEGQYRAAARSMLKATGKIGYNVAKGYATDKLVGAAVGKTASALSGSSKAIYQTAGKLLGRHGETAYGAESMAEEMGGSSIGGALDLKG